MPQVSLLPFRGLAIRTVRTCPSALRPSLPWPPPLSSPYLRSRCAHRGGGSAGTGSSGAGGLSRLGQTTPAKADGCGHQASSPTSHPSPPPKKKKEKRGRRVSRFQLFNEVLGLGKDSAGTHGWPVPPAEAAGVSRRCLLAWLPPRGFLSTRAPQLRGQRRCDP